MMSALLAHLAALGLTDAQVGALLGMSGRTILRRRQAAGIPSAYVPPAPELVHGTASGYRHHRCRCRACRRANSLATQRLTRRYQAATARAAERHGQPWTRAEDRSLAAHTGPLVEWCRAHGRTYAAARNRLDVLRGSMG